MAFGEKLLLEGKKKKGHFVKCGKRRLCRPLILISGILIIAISSQLTKGLRLSCAITKEAKFWPSNYNILNLNIP